MITNTGNTVLRNINLTDDNGTLDRNFIGNLNVGQSITTTSRHTITQDDLNAGEVRNQITGAGINSNGDDVSDLSDDPDDDTNVDTNGNGNPDDITITPLTRNDDIAIIKEGILNDANGDGFAQVGEEITYTFTIEIQGIVI
ncbi:DUF7507 domain-containing protein [Nonlabens ponticola]|uniref:DUF7507 domain-containing protein n=1 Tax=Nonlabens ponticola TaxID=2496866 RepID=A0A3S9N146_9FLAO|nr:hypothetical protein [Nonlabens ponticola]AZQ45118.1 hypothetical protein EJ995_13095 [Nonlabens ponticola]